MPLNRLVFVLLLMTTSLNGQERLYSVVPLYDETTKLEPAIQSSTEDALITRVADRVRDRHAREDGAYDHYLSFYWEERTVAIEIADRVAKGGKDITINIKSLAPLNKPDFRCFFRGINTVAEYFHNVATKEVAPNHYTTTVTYNNIENRALQVGDRMEFEFSPFLLEPKRGRSNYYGTAFLYIVGKGLVPWIGRGEKLDSQPQSHSMTLGGGTTLHVPYSNEPDNRFKQMANNLAPISAQPFMLGRRLHHTDFGDGRHSEQPNPVFEKHKNKLGPHYVARSCVACHVNNGRALPPAVGEPMYQTVIKVAGNSTGAPHQTLGTAIQPQLLFGDGEANAVIRAWSYDDGKYPDGKPFSVRYPLYRFNGIEPEFYSVRLTPSLVGLGLLEAISELDILIHADQDDLDGDGISGKPQIVKDPLTGQSRLGRFGYKAGQATVRFQIAGALNSDMGVTTSIQPYLDGEEKEEEEPDPELSDESLLNMTRYVSSLGVPPRRNVDAKDVQRGEKLFETIGCASCHIPMWKTSKYHPQAELRSQTIWPYTDLLLHDMGKELADEMTEGKATRREWRTPPLWGIGATAGVSGGEAYLHDGRARTLEEAILWHGGESAQSNVKFRELSEADRLAVIAFLKSL